VETRGNQRAKALDRDQRPRERADEQGDLLPELFDRDRERAATRADVARDPTHRTIVGVRVRRVAHTEAAFVVDVAGYQRAVFVYPFSAADVERELDIVG
jgi:hypothetical protein